MAKISEYRGFVVSMFCFLCIQIKAQKECKLVIKLVEGEQNLSTDLQFPSTFPTKDKCFSYVKELPQLLATKGYISASVDSVLEDSSSVRLLLFTGKKYIWDSLHIRENDWPLLNQLGYNHSSFNNKPFNQQKVNTIYKELLDYFSNNGHPFAKIYLDSIELNNGLISGNLNIDEGTLYYIDTIMLDGNIKLSKNFIMRYLDINEHSVYRQNKLDKIDNRFAELSFLQQVQPHTVSMLNTGAELNLYLQNKASNQINAVIGFLPSNQQTGGKLLVTGEANLNLRNPFGNGEAIGLNWQQLQPKSPRLNLLFERPYIFNSPVGLNLNFELYKRDSFFLNIHFQVGTQYNISTKQSIIIFGQLYKSNVLSVDTSFVIATKKLPDIIDLTETSLSFQYNFNNTNYRFNPREGNELKITSGFGRKYIHQNNTILQIKDTSFNYTKLYDTIQQKGYTFRSTLSAAHYFPLGKQATFKTALNAGWLQSQNYFQNELFQIGGYKLLRGFDEESIYTNLFAVSTLEYRYLLAQNSWFFVFSDIGYADYKTNSMKYDHTYVGVGTGLAFETKTGIFNISYAVGKRDDLKWDLRQSKIHIGFVSLF